MTAPVSINQDHEERRKIQKVRQEFGATHQLKTAQVVRIESAGDSVALVLTTGSEKAEGESIAFLSDGRSLMKLSRYIQRDLAPTAHDEAIASLERIEAYLDGLQGKTFGTE